MPMASGLNELLRITLPALGSKSAVPEKPPPMITLPVESTATESPP
jgi:hypothetical protein